MANRVQSEGGQRGTTRCARQNYTRLSRRAFLHQPLNRIGQMFRHDMMVAALDSQPECPHQHIHRAETLGWFKLVTGQFNLESVGVVQIDGVHEAAIAFQKLDSALTQARRDLLNRGARHVKRDVLHAAHVTRGWPVSRGSRFIGEHREQTPIARVEIEMILFRLPEIGLLEDEAHAEQSAPEIERHLFGRAHDGDVMQPLHLNLFHGTRGEG